VVPLDEVQLALVREREAKPAKPIFGSPFSSASSVSSSSGVMGDSTSLSTSVISEAEHGVAGAQLGEFGEPTIRQ
jgi:hypothetical protein